MGEKTQKFADEVGENDLYEILLREDIFYNPSGIFRLLDDREILALFRSVRERLIGAVLDAPEGSSEKSEARRLLTVFREAYHNAGFDKANGVDKEKPVSGSASDMSGSAMDSVTDKDIDGLLEGFGEEAEVPSLEALARDFDVAITPSGEYRGIPDGQSVASNGTKRTIGKLTLEIARTPGLTEQMRGQIVVLGPTFRRAVEGRDKTMHVGSPGFHGFPEKISIGEELVFSFGDKKSPRRVKVTRVEEYGSIAQLTDNEPLTELQKMFLGKKKMEIMGNMMKLFREERVRENGLILFEFELID